MRKKKIYLAGPFFKENERENIKKFAETLRKEYEVFVPMEHFVENGEKMPNLLWGEKVFEIDKKGIDECDMVIALDYGFTSDAGTAWEVGYAYGLGASVFVVSMAKKIGLHSLMLVNGNTRFFSSFSSLMEFLHSDKNGQENLEGKIMVK